MRRRVFVALVVVGALAGTTVAEDPILFNDAHLKAAVEAQLGKSNPTPTDMLGLTSLDAHSQGITDLTGLQYATNLKWLHLWDNQINDISPLAGLTNLNDLVLGRNPISDISALAGLTNLTELGLYHNQISDISPLVGLTNLRGLSLSWNQISGISALAGLTNLNYLSLDGNQISDISVLAGLTNLMTLTLGWNQIGDISVLAGLTNLTWLAMAGNQINDISVLAGLTNLTAITLSRNQINDISVLAGLMNLDRLWLDYNPLKLEAYCTYLRQIAENNPGIDLSYSPNVNPPSSIAASDGNFADKVRVTWDALCPGPNGGQTFQYKVYRSDSPSGTRTAISGWLTDIRFDDTSALPGVHCWYWVTSDNTESYTQADEGWCAGPDRMLTVSSTAGGLMIEPGIGTFQYPDRGFIFLQAKAKPLFRFDRWSGTFSGQANPTFIEMDADHQVRACFVSLLDILYVDDNSSGDPGPGDPNLSDPDENGTPDRPFDSIQEAIVAAKEGARVMVRPGTYLETIDLMGKRIEVNGLNPDDPNITDLPVIDGQGRDTVVRCTQREDPNCVLSGLVITGGKGSLAGGALCLGSSPTIVNCLIVGNRAIDAYGRPANGGAVYCQDSNALFAHCTISGNYGDDKGAGLWFKDSQAVVTNSIVWGNGPKEVLAQGSIQPVITYTDVSGSWPGAGNIEADPLFAMPGYWANPSDLTKAVAGSDPAAVWVQGDYHLRSQAGRWDPAARAWIVDAVSSLCIDAGDPASLMGAEPMPNGNRVNRGAYGGTPQASLSNK